MVSSKEEAHHIMGPDKRVTQLAYYLTGQVVAAYIVGNGLKPFPTRISGAPVNGISQTQLASACLREVPLCGAKAGAFSSSPRKMDFSTNG
jgi:hypothetical protein